MITASVMKELNNDVNIKVNFQKMWIPLYIFYSKFSCARHTNPKFFGTLQKAVLRN